MGAVPEEGRWDLLALGGGAKAAGVVLHVAPDDVRDEHPVGQAARVGHVDVGGDPLNTVVAFLHVERQAMGLETTRTAPLLLRIAMIVLPLASSFSA